jgi:hypothetical protein
MNEGRTRTPAEQALLDRARQQPVQVVEMQNPATGLIERVASRFEQVAPPKLENGPTPHLRQLKGQDGLLRMQQKWLVGGIPEWRPIPVVTWFEVGIHE